MNHQKFQENAEKGGYQQRGLPFKHYNKILMEENKLKSALLCAGIQFQNTEMKSVFTWSPF